MTRNMIAANSAVFALLDDFNLKRNMPLENAGQPRWIATDAEDRRILRDCTLARSFVINPTRTIARFDKGADNIFVLAGFDPAVTSSWLTPVPVGAGLLTAVLSELKLKPVGSALEIKQIVDAEDKRAPGYSGHNSVAISSLFPEIRSFWGYNLASDVNERVVFDFILSETVLSGNWIDEELSRNLRQLIELDLIGIPYMTVARSMLDFDQSSLFMSLYRCLESLYAHAGANRLRSSLGIAATWDQVAVALEADLNWRPIEWQSLEALMAMGAMTDLLLIRDSISPAFPGYPPTDVVRAASDYLYKLRNSVVHFRPSHSKVDHTLVNWNELCGACATLISYVYSEVFGSL